VLAESLLISVISLDLNIIDVVLDAAILVDLSILERSENSLCE